MTQTEGIVFLVVLAVANIPVYIAIGRVLFGDWEAFFEALKMAARPDLWSALLGEYWDDLWAEIKLMLWASGCLLALCLESALLEPVAVAAIHAVKGI